MTEEEWLHSTDPLVILGRIKVARIGHRAPFGSLPIDLSDRKLRLYAAAVERVRNNVLGIDYLTDAVAIGYAERIADAQFKVSDLAGWKQHCVLAYKAIDAASACTSELLHYVYRPDYSIRLAELLRDILGNPFRPLGFPEDPACPWCAGKAGHAWECYGEEREWKLLEEEPITGWTPCTKCKGTGRQKTRADLVTAPVLALANAAYDLRLPDYTLDPARLAVLADALEEAGCEDERILCPLRGLVPLSLDRERVMGRLPWVEGAAPPRYRGWHVLDVILGKE